MTRIIDLNLYKTPGALVFLGRENGRRVKEMSQISKYLYSGELITLIIPNNFYSVCPSFYEELLRDVKDKYKKDNIKSVQIQSDNSSIINTLNKFMYE